MIVNGSIHEASEAAHTALEASRLHHRRDVRRLRTVRALDRVIESLEEVNLAGAGFEPVSGEALVAVAKIAETDLPPAVLGATTPVDLHEALLDWQEQLLDRAKPSRLDYREVDNEIDPPEQRRRRRRRRAPLSLRSAA